VCPSRTSPEHTRFPFPRRSFPSRDRRRRRRSVGFESGRRSVAPLTPRGARSVATGPKRPLRPPGPKRPRRRPAPKRRASNLPRRLNRRVRPQKYRFGTQSLVATNLLFLVTPVQLRGKVAIGGYITAPTATPRRLPWLPLCPVFLCPPPGRARPCARPSPRKEQ